MYYSQNIVKKWINDTFNNRSNVDNEYSNLIKNKRVIIVGPSPYLENKNLGKIFDQYDLVVRINHGFCLSESNPNDYGSRTDIIYCNQKMRHHYKNKYPEKWLSNLKVINSTYQIFPNNPTTSHYCYKCKNIILPETLIDFQKIKENNQSMEPKLYIYHALCLEHNQDDFFSSLYPKLLFRKVSNNLLPRMDGSQDSFMYNSQMSELPDFTLTGVYAILDILIKNPSELRIAGMDFYAGAKNINETSINPKDYNQITDKYINQYEQIYASGYQIVVDKEKTNLYPHFDTNKIQLKFLKTIIDMANDDYFKNSKLIIDKVLHTIINSV